MSKKKQPKKEEAFLKAAEAVEKAHESTIPFPITDNGEVMVVGDANETQLNKHDFKVRFRIPVKKDDGSVEYTIKEKEFKDVYITPRMDAKIMRTMTQIVPYFSKIESNGELSSLTQEEKLSLAENLDDEFFDAMYDLTIAVLGIDRSLRDYMLPQDAVFSAIQIMELYPEVVNTADTFFG